MFKTRFTELLNVEYPIQCGTMMYISDADFVAANANAGVFSCLVSAMFPTERELVDEIKKLKDLTERPFGVNISLFPGLLPMPVERYLDILAHQEIRIVETAGRNPQPYRDKIRESGFFHIHKCARLRDAVKAESLGVDMVSVVGTECGGHPSMEDVTSLVLIPEVADRISIPLVAGGGFCDGRTLVAALSLGADAVLMGTRFLNTPECRIHPALKEKLIQARETDTVVIQRSIGSATRVLRNAWADTILEMESKGATLEELMPYIGGKRAEHAWVHGEDDAAFSCGQAVGRTKESLPIKDLVAQIMSEAEETSQRILKVTS
jgi:NAD(P)H-dependent flavin oxidoreductase YrpB (nitropropane dioxygenase family)